MKTLILMRGLPGSGKSTLAKELACGGPVFSTDDYFMVDGKYTFVGGDIGKAHEWNLNRAVAAIESGEPLIVIDNTNTQAWEMREYVKAGKENGYEIEFRFPITEWAFDVDECTKRNTHGVPNKAIKRMRHRFERNLTVDIVLAAKAPWEK